MSDTRARARRFAFWFGSLARNGLIGALGAGPPAAPAGGAAGPGRAGAPPGTTPAAAGADAPPAGWGAPKAGRACGGTAGGADGGRAGCAGAAPGNPPPAPLAGMAGPGRAAGAAGRGCAAGAAGGRAAPPPDGDPIPRCDGSSSEASGRVGDGGGIGGRPGMVIGRCGCAFCPPGAGGRGGNAAGPLARPPGWAAAAWPPCCHAGGCGGAGCRGGPGMRPGGWTGCAAPAGCPPFAAPTEITPPHTEHRARTPAAGTFAGSTRKTDRHSGQLTFIAIPRSPADSWARPTDPRMTDPVGGRS